MPVILERENYDVGLDLGFRKVEPLLDLLLPYRADSMRQYRVSTRVNSVQNDGPACAEEYSPQMYLEKLNRRASEMAQSTDEQTGTVTVRERILARFWHGRGRKSRVGVVIKFETALESISPVMSGRSAAW
jgi:hypothetical protein